MPLFGLLEHPEDIPILAPLVEREILYHLLRGPDGPALKQLVQAGGTSKQIHDVIFWLRRNYAKPFSIDTLIEIGNMSASSLHSHFEIVTGLSPLQYQKQVPLQEARRLLLETIEDAASVGFSFGYESATQTSCEYRRKFGALPCKMR